MWDIFTILIFVVQIILVAIFVIGSFHKRKLNETAFFVAAVVVINYALHIIPYVYNVIELGEKPNHVFGLYSCFKSSVAMFVGNPSFGSVAAFADAVPLFSYVYLLQTFIAVLTTVSAAIIAFGNSIRNGFILSKTLKKEVCDIVIGNSSETLNYAKTCNSVLLLDDNVSKETVSELMTEGYVVMRGIFCEDLLKGKKLNAYTRYNFICADEEKAMEYIETFIAYKKTKDAKKNIHLFARLEGNKAETVKREIVEKNGMGAFVNTFSLNEMLARKFTEENPVTKYLPRDCFEKAYIKSDSEINVFILGLGKLGKELYRQYLLNNQLVTFVGGEYKVLPINYFLCDENVNPDDWNINGLKDALGELSREDYFELPEMPFNAEIVGKSPCSREVLTRIKKQAEKPCGYTFVIIDTEEDCLNIELGTKIKSMLFGMEKYHIFVQSEVSFVENDDFVTYFGKRTEIFNHDVIVNDSLSVIAKKLNEVYTGRYASEEKERPDFAEYVKKKAEDSWRTFDSFTMYSNIYAAMNLRVKLNLLGLDYIEDGKGENLELIGKRSEHKGEYEYDEYFEPSVRNSLIAQEHARWNVYHLLAEYLPLEKREITVKSDDGKKVKFNVKNTAAKKHACITTYKGLDTLSSYLAEKAGGECTSADYDYYIHDEMLITSAEELLQSLGCSVTLL